MKTIPDEKLGKKFDCDCDDWKESANQIFSVQIFHTLRTGEKYTGEVFKYCPWCGKKLKEIDPT